MKDPFGVKNARHPSDTNGWLQSVLSEQLSGVVRRRKAALDSGKGIHQMRVATRRLRGTVQDFFPDQRPFKPIQRELKRLQDRLGDVRDHDVAIAAFSKRRSKVKNKKLSRGIGKLIARRSRLRDKAHLKLKKKAISKSKLNSLEQSISSAVRETPKLNHFNGARNETIAGEAVDLRLKEFRRLGQCIYRPASNKKLHRLRISAKRLRYAAKLFEDHRNGKAKNFSKRIAKMQTLLGNVHDCDVWIESLSNMLAGKVKGKELCKTERAAAVRLISDFTGERSKNYRAALKLWNEWDKNGFFEQLKSSVSKGTSR